MELSIARAEKVSKQYADAVKAYCRAMEVVTPIGSLVEIKRGKSATKTGGWSGPYEIRGHGWNAPTELILANCRTGKIVKWYVMPGYIREYNESPEHD